MIPPRALRLLPGLAMGAGAVTLLLAPTLCIPPTRGASRVTEGFRPGRWDARFLVARGPAALRLPEAPLRLTLSLSGPANVAVRGGGRMERVAVGTAPSPVDWMLPAGGAVSLEADATIRLHELSVRRTGSPPWPRVAAVLLAMLAALVGAWRGNGRRAVVANLMLGAVIAVVVQSDGLPALALRVFGDRLAPTLAVMVLGGLFVAPFRLPKAPSRDRALGPLPTIFGGLALASCLGQVLLLPQPLLIGDPAAYHDIGGRFRDALAPVRTPDDLADALATLRPYGGLAATGLFYGLLRGVRDQLSTIYIGQALAMAGAVGFLVRAAVRLGGARLALITGVAALLYPTFPILCGIVQPEPLILLLWTFSLDRLLSACERDDLRGFAMAGLGFAFGLALHPQGIWFLLVALALVLLPFARRLMGMPMRIRAAAFALGLLPLAAAVAAGETYARPAFPALEERHGFWAYTARMPLGFWLFLDTDGWQGALRLDETRYAAGLRRAEETGAVTGPLGRWLYTGRFVFENAGASLRTVFRNLHRLFHIPDNPFRRAWILPYALQVPWHRALVVLFLIATPILIASGGAPVLVPFAILSATYPLYHVFNKYAVPATPFLILGAAMSVERLLSPPAIPLLAALGAASVGAILTPADLALHGLAPDAARGLLTFLHLGGLATAFGLAAHRWAPAPFLRGATAVAAAALILPSLAASWGDPSWRSFAFPLDSSVRQEITVGPEGLTRLGSAREAYLVLDLLLPDGDPGRLRLEFETGLVVPGQELEPTMPPFPLAAARGGRDPRTFPQWWRTRFRSEMGRDGRVALLVRGPHEARIRGELGTPGPDNVLDGLSLGEWPYRSVYRLMHDGEYRLPKPQLLASLGRSSQSGGQTLPGTLGVRLVVLDEDTGGADWETAPAPTAQAVTGVWARAGRGGWADLLLPEGPVRFSLGGSEGGASPAGEVRVFPTGEYEGWYVIKTRATPGQALHLAVRPLAEMSSTPKFFLPEARNDRPPAPLDWAGLPFVPLARILESKEAPSWRPATLY